MKKITKITQITVAVVFALTLSLGGVGCKRTAKNAENPPLKSASLVTNTPAAAQASGGKSTAP